MSGRAGRAGRAGRQEGRKAGRQGRAGQAESGVLRSMHLKQWKFRVVALSGPKVSMRNTCQPSRGKQR
eukprot:765287-Hanusia_phi.AAC.4